MCHPARYTRWGLFSEAHLHVPNLDIFWKKNDFYIFTGLGRNHAALRAVLQTKLPIKSP